VIAAEASDGFAKRMRVRRVRKDGTGGRWICKVVGVVGEFGRVLMYADLPTVRAWRAGAQLGSACVFAVRGSESALSVLLSELPTAQEARAVPTSGV
jgi:hypothetical protein